MKLKGYATTDLSAQKEFFQKRVFLAGGVTNLFDKRYITLSYPRPWYGGNPLPDKGRTFFVRLEYRL
jgi:outer membrane receptor protein involved in Fe transport